MTETIAVAGMSPAIVALFIFVLACFIGYFVIWGVTPSLHTPLISLTNAISGIIIVGAILVAGSANATGLEQGMGFIAVTLASVNIFGGFAVTQRMLSMFKKKDK
jgi:proton-translocating NAD(P)+ transhydrogenase subunit alpha